MRRSPGRIIVAVIFVLLALNAWAQAIVVLLGRSDDPPMLTLLQVLVGGSATLAAVGSWTAARWAPAAAMSYGVITGAMIVLLDPLLDIGPEGRKGLWFGAAVVLLVSLGLAWFLRWSLRTDQTRRGDQ